MVTCVPQSSDFPAWRRTIGVTTCGHTEPQVCEYFSPIIPVPVTTTSPSIASTDADTLTKLVNRGPAHVKCYA
jgi:hypothetical protein